MQVHDLRTALAHYEAALALDSTAYEANWRAAITLLDEGQQIPDSVKSPERDSLYARAERLARRAVAADSLGADGHFALAAAVGRASLTMGKKDRIRRARVIRDEAQRAIELNPRHDGAYHILGRWNAEIMRLSGLSRFFAKRLLGAGVFGEASWEGAVSNMEHAVALDPGRLYHRLELAEIYVDRKRYDDARAELAQLAALPDREIMDSVYRRQGRELAKKIANKR
jgi:tetratricopeptide (TPR) repeat protein